MPPLCHALHTLPVGVAVGCRSDWMRRPSGAALVRRGLCSSMLVLPTVCGRGQCVRAVNPLRACLSCILACACASLNCCGRTAVAELLWLPGPPRTSCRDSAPTADIMPRQRPLEMQARTHVQVLLTKLRVFARGTAQLVCISATMGGLNPVIDWLDARLFLTNFRPVQLIEHLCLSTAVFSAPQKPPSCNGGTSQPAGSQACLPPKRQKLAAGYTVPKVPSTGIPQLPSDGGFPQNVLDGELCSRGLCLQRTLPREIVPQLKRTSTVGERISLALACEVMHVRPIVASSQMLFCSLAPRHNVFSCLTSVGLCGAGARGDACLLQYAAPV